jgi:hypothetical protein
MDFEELALAFDAQEIPVEAAWAYEVAISAPKANLDLFLNLAVLYFECLDFGYASRHRLSEGFTSGAWDRAFDVLNKAEERFGRRTEIEFWRLYFSHIYSGEELTVSACKELTKGKDSLVPFMYLFTSSGKTLFLEEACQLFELVRDCTTERKRYIKSILDPLPRVQN